MEYFRVHIRYSPYWGVGSDSVFIPNSPASTLFKAIECTFGAHFIEVGYDGI